MNLEIYLISFLSCMIHISLNAFTMRLCAFNFELKLSLVSLEAHTEYKIMVD